MRKTIGGPSPGGAERSAEPFNPTMSEHHWPRKHRLRARYGLRSAARTNWASCCCIFRAIRISRRTKTLLGDETTKKSRRCVIMAINLYRVVLPTTMGTYAAAGSLLAYSSDFAQSVIMRLWSILSFAVGLSMANPIAGLNEEMKGEIEAAIRKLEPKLNAFDLNTFATNVERRDDAEDLVSVSNPLLVARRK